MSWTYEATTACVAPARNDLTAWLEASSISPAPVSDVELIVSELVSNAVDAAPGREVTLAARLHSAVDRLEVSVSNDGSADQIGDPSEWAPDEVLAKRGRGLMIVAALSDEVQVTEQDERVTVTAVISTRPS